MAPHIIRRSRLSQRLVSGILTVGLAMAGFCAPPNAEAQVAPDFNCYPNLDPLFEDEPIRPYAIALGTGAVIGTVLALASKGRKGNRAAGLTIAVAGIGLSVAAPLMLRRQVIDPCTGLEVTSKLTDQSGALMGVGLGMTIGGFAVAKSSNVARIPMRNRTHIIVAPARAMERVGWRTLPSWIGNSQAVKSLDW